MTIVTFLGMIGAQETGRAELKHTIYRLSPVLAKTLGVQSGDLRYANMLPLLLENFKEAKIVAVGTKESHKTQTSLLKELYPELAKKEYEKVLLSDTNDYHAIFKELSETLDGKDDVVVDISHSFRHLPALMMVGMVVENIKNPGRIRHILFAKGYEPKRGYEIVDLREYLSLANISYALASFTKNYTIAVSVRTVDKTYQDLLNTLSLFGEHIMSNSLEALLHGSGKNGDVSITNKVLKKLETIRKDREKEDLIRPLLPYIEEISGHMKEILSHAYDPDDERLFFFAKLMFEKGYLLNSLTLINEAAAAYCAEGLKKEPAIREPLEELERLFKNRYEPTNMAKNVVKLGDKFSAKSYKDAKKTEIAKIFANHAKEYVKSFEKRVRELRRFLIDCDDRRNNLAHANSSRRLEEVKMEIEELLNRYQKICREDDPLRRFGR